MERTIPRPGHVGASIVWSMTPDSIIGRRGRAVSWGRNAAHYSPSFSATDVRLVRERRHPGGVPEWLKGPVSKTGVPLRGTEGSNPSSSADSRHFDQSAACRERPEVPGYFAGSAPGIIS